MAKQYVVIPRIEYRGANAQPVWWLAAAPGPMAFCGLAKALAMTIGASNHLISAGAVIHDFRFRAEQLEGFRILPHQMRGAVLIDEKDYASGTKSLSGQPTIRGDGIVSVVIAFDDDVVIDMGKITDFLDRARVGGGTIASHLFSAKNNCLYDRWSDVLKRIPSGFCMVDRADLLVPRSGEDPLDAFVRVTRKPIEDANKRKTEDERKAREARSYLTPYNAAYRALTPMAQRNGVRDGHPHAFVEPMVGLMQLVSRRKTEIAMWKHAQPSEDLFAVQPLPVASIQKMATTDSVSVVS